MKPFFILYIVSMHLNHINRALIAADLYFRFTQ